jgi:uncharacterized delta-60 repeat protein
VAAGFRRIVPQPDGKILVTGGFTEINGVNTPHFVRLHADGSFDTTFEPDILPVEIAAIHVQSDGRIVLAGISRPWAPGLLRLMPDGSLDPGFAATDEPNHYTSLAVQPDEKLLVGALGMQTIHGVTRRGVARLNPDGTVDTSFMDPRVMFDTPLKGGGVQCVALQQDGKVLIGGQFLSVGGLSRRGIARLNADGSLDSSFNPGSFGSIISGSGYLDSEIFTLVLEPSGKIIIVGRFSRISGVHRSNFARLNSDGSLDQTYVSPGILYWVHSVALQQDGKLWVSGSPRSRSDAPNTLLFRLYGGDVLPSVRIVRSAEEVILSWPAQGSTGAVLESANPAAETLIWSPEALSPSIVGDQHVLSIKPTEEARIYRLRKD